MPRILSAVAEGEADIGISFDPTFNADLRQVADVRVALGAAMSPAHPLARLKSLRLADVVGDAIFLVDDNFVIQRRLAAQTKGGGPVQVRIVETNSFEAMTAIVKQGVGIGLRTRIGITDEIARGEIAFAPFTDRKFRGETIVINTKARRTLPVAVALLSERLAAALSRLGDI